MIVKIEISNQKICIRNGSNIQFFSINGAFNHLSELFLDDAALKVMVDTREPKIMVQRYVDKKISKVQLEYLVKIISERTERMAYIKILCKWLTENSIRWEKLQ